MWRLNFKLTRPAKCLRCWSRSKIGNISLLSLVAEQVTLALDHAQDSCDLTSPSWVFEFFFGLSCLGWLLCSGCASGSGPVSSGCAPVTPNPIFFTSRPMEDGTESSFLCSILMLVRSPFKLMNRASCSNILLHLLAPLPPEPAPLAGTTLRSSGTIYVLWMCLSPRKKSRLQFLISLLVKHQALMGSRLTSLSTVGVFDQGGSNLYF